MKRTISISLLIIAATLLLGIFAYAAQNSDTMMTPGDEVYACGCSKGCDCHTISKNPGKCTCDKDLVKSTVVMVDEGMAKLDVNGKEKTFPTKGKYTCACGPTCNCDTISQNPGKCTCGKPMTPVKQ